MHRPPVFERQLTTTGRPRLVAYVPGSQPDLFERLTALLPEPFYVLYVLHTPRGEGEPGRYQSPQLSRDQLNGFLTSYRSFFAADARQDLWVYSIASGQTLVWDRHNQLFAEGEPLEDMIRLLGESGLREGCPEPLDAHIHHYRAEYDETAAALLAELDWYRTPLRPEDEQ